MKFLISASFIFAVGCLTATASTTGILLNTFNDPTVSSQDRFGSSVAIDGDYVLIGAPWHGPFGVGTGQAHLFDATTGSLLHTLNNPSGIIGGLFGSSVALDGNLALVGAPFDDTNGSNVGSAHLFDTATGNLIQTFNDPSMTSNDSFAGSIAIDGNYVLIGAPGDINSNDVDNIGKAYLFDATIGSLIQTFNDPSAGVLHLFGSSVSIDGDYVLIGAEQDFTNGVHVGLVHLFDATTGSLLQTFNDPTVTGSDGFGSSVALDGNLALIGAPRDDTNGFNVGQVHLFDAATGSLLQTFNDPTVTDQDFFGSSVAIDGDYVLIGAYSDDTNGGQVGQAHLFDTATGSLVHTFNDPTVTAIDLFGISVSLDGNHVLVGASGDDTNGSFVGQAHLFEIPEPGASCLLLVASLFLGCCRVYTVDSTCWR